MTQPMILRLAFLNLGWRLKQGCRTNERLFLCVRRNAHRDDQVALSFAVFAFSALPVSPIVAERGYAILRRYMHNTRILFTRGDITSNFFLQRKSLQWSFIVSCPASNCTTKCRSQHGFRLQLVGPSMKPSMVSNTSFRTLTRLALQTRHLRR